MSDKKYLLTAISTVAAASFSLSAMASQDAGTNPFQAEDLPAGFQVSADDHKEGKCGEGSCGEDKDKEGSCGEGSCGEDKDEEGSCGEGSCGEDSGDDKDEEGSCGEGTCGTV
ncbi:HvfA family oxazolone/thioamide-modified RiPP metallophore [Wenzhouxiangella sp. EGI_FJ10305]|uniref:HvfA family oxazolone/thioamide-modified RiPP metallophore n=1 Tax=Wenzhouxiangella sp. EGI_FJ10305 TaxID=3243768 RepID=UPI0035DB4595